MSRENLLFGVIGILLGFIVGFMFASSMSQKTQNPASVSQNMPADHPAVGAQAGGGNPEQVRAQVTADIEKARKEPQNFDAQVKAAELFYRIGRFDQSIEFLLKANQLKPSDYDTVVSLGMVNFQAGHYDPAEKWLTAAIKMKPDDVTVLEGLTDTKLQKGDAKGAEEAIAQLEKANPNSEELPRFRDLLTKLKSK
ncbi:MAG TPA: tetratricopeptide repeat protein [Pyrinomonadaceae bacterium]|nr:tetratricopeptide repeat protein [Pyrinomonadaceae bacterium]